MKTMTATQAFEQVRLQAESIKNDADCRFPEAASFGNYWAQGDIFIHLLEKVPAKAKQCPVELQLAPGTTQGSRHILSHGNVEMFRIPDADVLTGPIIRNKTEVTVTHPEHGNVILPPGTYKITYERAYAEELRRVAD